MRVLFYRGKQREFFKIILEKINCISLRSLNERGVNVNYQTLKSYYHEDRSLPEELFLELCRLAGLKPEGFKFKLMNEHWGQVKGGRL